MDYQDFNSQYQILEYGYAQQFGIQNNVCLITPVYPQEKQKSNLVSIKISKMSIDEKVLLKYRTLKFLTILQPEQYIQTQDEHCLIYENLYEHLLNQDKLINMTQQQGYKFLLQLVLTFAEFQKRQIHWALKSINQIYYIQGIIYFSLLEYDFEQFNQPIDYLYNFWFFFDQYFSYRFQDFAQLKSEKKSLDEILQYLFEKNGNIHKQNMMNPDYEKVLQYLLNIDTFQQLYYGNCVVKQFKRNGLFSIYPNLTDDIVYKSTKILGDEQLQQQLRNQIQRDIELMELFSNKENVASCFTYLRIKEYTFLLYKKFAGTLADRFRNWPNKDQTVDSIKKDVYVIASRTADSLRILHEKNIIHRDLKPENIFLDNENLSESFSYVADFDCSKQIQDEQDVICTKADCAFTPKYDPPEQKLSLKYDIFQLGLILYILANKGNYVGSKTPRLYREDEFELLFSKKAVKAQLSSLDYDNNFIDIIAQCLLRDPSERPDIKTVCTQLQQFKAQRKIKITSPSKIQQKDQNNYQQNQLLYLGNSPNLVGLAQTNNEDSSPSPPKRGSVRILSNQTAQETNIRILNVQTAQDQGQTYFQQQQQNPPAYNYIPLTQPQQNIKVTQLQVQAQPNYQEQLNSQNFNVQSQQINQQQQQNFNQNINFYNVVQQQQSSFIPQQQAYKSNNQQQQQFNQQYPPYDQQQQQFNQQYPPYDQQQQQFNQQYPPYDQQQQQFFQQNPRSDQQQQPIFQQQTNNQQQFQQQYQFNRQLSQTKIKILNLPQPGQFQ